MCWETHICAPEAARKIAACLTFQGFKNHSAGANADVHPRAGTTASIFEPDGFSATPVITGQLQKCEDDQELAFCSEARQDSAIQPPWNTCHSRVGGTRTRRRSDCQEAADEGGKQPAGRLAASTHAVTAHCLRIRLRCLWRDDDLPELRQQPEARLATAKSRPRLFEQVWATSATVSC